MTRRSWAVGSSLASELDIQSEVRDKSDEWGPVLDAWNGTRLSVTSDSARAIVSGLCEISNYADEICHSAAKIGPDEVAHYNRVARSAATLMLRVANFLEVTP